MKKKVKFIREKRVHPSAMKSKVRCRSVDSAFTRCENEANDSQLII